MYFLATIYEMCQDANSSLMVILKLARTLITVIQIAVPIILIVLGSWDLGKAVIQSDEKKIKEQQQIFIKRLIAAVLVFFVTIIVNIVIGILPVSGETVPGGTQSTWSYCWDKASK